MTLAIAIISYAAAMIVANLTIAAFGPVVAPINAFLLIGLDLALRDWLHIRLRSWQMLALIAGAGLVTFLLNPAAGTIAVASTTAFVSAAAVDWLVFSKMRGAWLLRSNTSNIAGAAVDSAVFPLIAFGSLASQIVIPMFAAKVCGGAIWAFAIAKLMNKKL